MTSLGAALGIQHRPGEERWWRRARCASPQQSWALFYPEDGSRRGRNTVTDDRAKRICAQCPVRVECLTEALTSEAPTKSILRSLSTQPLRDMERALPSGIWGGQTARERWAGDLTELPIPERVAILDERFAEQAPRFLAPGEAVV